jgi:hypothetical protein
MRRLALTAVIAVALLTALTVSGAIAGTASATLSGPILNIQATTASGLTGSLQLDNPWGATLTDSASWVLDHDVNIMSGDTVIAKLTAFQWSLDYSADPAVVMFFGVQAGSSDTNITVTPATMSFSPITNGQAYASAGLTLTGDENGAAATGLFSGKCYQFRYNNTGSGGTVFTNLVGSFTTPINSTTTVSDRNPGFGRVVIPGSVGEIESEYHFTLSANDLASGTSRFDIIPVPEPSGLLALCSGLAGLMGFAVRRRR